MNRIFVLICAVILSGCVSTLTPIVKPTKYYSPREKCRIVDSIPDETIYIGTIKIVPGDDALNSSGKRLQQTIHAIQEHAARVGADYVVITDWQKNNKDYKFDISWSDGYTVEGEMFRSIGK